MHDGYMHDGYMHYGYMHHGYMHDGYMHDGYMHYGYMHHGYNNQNHGYIHVPQRDTCIIYGALKDKVKHAQRAQSQPEGPQAGSRGPSTSSIIYWFCAKKSCINFSYT